eukprot:CAMPEP_0174830096 /NCGR_PEP_ID=MMETSP1114-20130205/2339_1 /TAXON_ID=312471 /ORGANISM="Neobodo designis, Strain CCAP 1951/1" /LENGTH=973 /DNA_ID=CAMNT_0016063881 /DNA_START=73 /DNA_END=2991 /DNA_ORIENTATION=+
MDGDEFEIVVIGDSGVGKSNILCRYAQNKFSHDIPATIGVDLVHPQLKIDGRDMRVKMWDTAGVEAFRSTVNKFCRSADAAMIVYDITDQRSFRNVHTWLQDFRWHTKKTFPKVLLVGNKSDLDDKREVKTEVAERFARENNMTFIETSALEHVNVDCAFEALVRKMLEAAAPGDVVPEKPNNIERFSATNATDLCTTTGSDEFKVLIIGDSGVGKSSIATRYAQDEFSTDTPTTIGPDVVRTVLTIDERPIQVNIWDTSGLPRFQDTMRMVYPSANAAMIVYDVTDRRSFEHVRTWLQELREHTQENAPKVLLVGNKSDMDDKREVKTEVAERFARENGMAFVETSALEKTNIDRAIVWCCASQQPMATASPVRECVVMAKTPNVEGFFLLMPPSAAGAFLGSPRVREWIDRDWGRHALLLFHDAAGGEVLAHLAVMHTAESFVLPWIAEKDLLYEVLAARNATTNESLAHLAARGGRVDVLAWIHEHVPFGPAVLEFWDAAETFEFWDATDNQGSTFTGAAAASGQQSVLEWVSRQAALRHCLGANQGQTGTVAHVAALHGHSRLLHWLALWAASEGDTSVLASVHDADAELLARPVDDDGRTIAHIAAAAGCIDTLEWLSATAPRVLAAQDERGRCIAHHAALGGQVGVLRWLRAHGDFGDAWLAAAMLADGRVAAHSAVWWLSRADDYRILEWLRAQCDLGIDASVGTWVTTTTNTDGETVAHDAARCGELSVLQSLPLDALRARRAKDDATVAHIAAEAGVAGVLQWLRAHEDFGDSWVDTAVDGNGENVAHAAARRGHVSVLQSLSVETLQTRRGKDGATIAHTAAAAGDVDVLKWLLARADLGSSLLQQRNDLGETIAHVAAAAGKAAVIAFAVAHDLVDLGETQPQADGRTLRDVLIQIATDSLQLGTVDTFFDHPVASLGAWHGVYRVPPRSARANAIISAPPIRLGQTTAYVAAPLPHTVVSG